MKNLFTLTLLIAFFAWIPSIQAQQSSKKLTPIQFSDKMSDITDSLYAKGTAWGAYYNTAAEKGNFASLTPYRKAIEDFVGKSIKNLKVMPDVNKSQGLRNAMIHFLEFEQKMIHDGFIPIEKLSAAATKADKDDLLAKLSNMAADEANELKRVSDEQDAYAKANGFTIESKKDAQNGQ